MKKIMNRIIVNPAFKDRVVFLETSAETGGHHSLFERTLQAGGKIFPHIHTAFTETFTAISGTLGLQLEDDILLVKPGESYTVLKNEVHNFFNPADEELVFRIKCSPGHQGMENALCIIYGLAGDGRTNKKGIPKSIYETALLTEMSGSYPTGRAAVLRPIFYLLAKRARKKGIERSLLDKYCR